MILLAMTDAVELCRIVQIALTFLTLVVLGARINAWWCSRWRCLLPAAGTGMIALLVCAGSIDALLHERPGGMSSFLVAGASVALFMQGCTVGLGRSHPKRVDHPAGGSYTAFRPDKAAPCGPDDPNC